MTVETNEAKFRIGLVVRRAFGLLLRHGVLLLPLTALLMSPAMSSYLASTLHPHPVSMPFGARPLGDKIGFFAVLVAMSALQFVAPAALAMSSLAELGEREHAIGERLAAGFRSGLAACVIALISLSGIVLGWIALVIPGLFLMAAWSVAIPVCVVESAGPLALLRRSWVLTRGCRGKIFALLLMDIAFWIASIPACYLVVVLPLYGTYGRPSLFADGLMLCATLILAAAVTSATTASIYVELRLVKEGGFGNRNLADAFD